MVALVLDSPALGFLFLWFWIRAFLSPWGELKQLCWCFYLQYVSENDHCFLLHSLQLPPPHPLLLQLLFQSLYFSSSLSALLLRSADQLAETKPGIFGWTFRGRKMLIYTEPDALRSWKKKVESEKQQIYELLCRKWSRMLWKYPPIHQ